MKAYYQNQIELYKAYQLQDYTFTPHLHNRLEIVYVSKGILKIRVAGEETLLKENDIAIIFPYQLHSFISTKDCEMLVQIFSTEYTLNIQPFLKTHIPKNSFIRNIKEDCAHAIKKAYEYDICQEETISRAYVALFMSFISQEIELIPSKHYDTHDILHKLLSYIDMHFTEALSLEELARQMHVTRYYISRIFTKQLYTSFPDYINQLRIEYALNLLSNSQLPISQVALECGFKSERTFFRVFREQMKVSPLQYRKTVYKVQKKP